MFQKIPIAASCPEQGAQENFIVNVTVDTVRGDLFTRIDGIDCRYLKQCPRVSNPGALKNCYVCKVAAEKYNLFL